MFTLINILLVAALLPWMFSRVAAYIHNCNPGDLPIRCDSHFECDDDEFYNCEVECTSLGSCSRAVFTSSVAICSGSTACSDTEFFFSDVFCFSGGLQITCQNMRLVGSRVFCSNVNNCERFNFVRCSCCDEAQGNGCPGYAERCSYDDPNAFCDMVDAGGKTCTEWFNPFCLEDHVPPTPQPTHAPSKTPTTRPSSSPTRRPSRAPTTREPTGHPTFSPTATPTPPPITGSPTKAPTRVPSNHPTKSPTRKPTWLPTKEPSQLPTPTPFTNKPTAAPSQAPLENQAPTAGNEAPGTEEEPTNVENPMSQPETVPAKTSNSEENVDGWDKLSRVGETLSILAILATFMGGVYPLYRWWTKKRNKPPQNADDAGSSTSAAE